MQWSIAPRPWRMPRCWKRPAGPGSLTATRASTSASVRPPALVEAAKREAGVSSTSELGVLALAMLARPDPVAAVFRRSEGRLGPDHDLEY